MKAWIPALIAAGAGTAAAATLSLSGSLGVALSSRAITVVSGTANMAAVTTGAATMTPTTTA